MMTITPAQAGTGTAAGTAARIVAEPGDGTRYDLLVTPDPHGGLLVTWTAQPALWWASRTRGGEVRRLCGGEHRGKAGRAYDAGIIGQLLDHHVRV